MIKKSTDKQHFNENAKEYVINVKNNRNKLHKKCCCVGSKYISEYYDFDTYEEAVKSGIEFTECAQCKDLEKERIEYNKKVEELEKKKEKPFMFFYWVVSILFGVIGFMIMNNKIVGKIFGAILFMGVGIVLALLTDAIISAIYGLICGATKRKVEPTKSLGVFIIRVLLCVLLAFLVAKTNFVSYHTPAKKYYDKWGNAHYSEKERDNENFRYYAYEAAKDYKRKY